MNLIQILGALALTIGGSLLASEVLLGKEFVTELTGSQFMPLRLICSAVVVLGVIALMLGLYERQEFQYHKGGKIL